MKWNERVFRGVHQFRLVGDDGAGLTGWCRSHRAALRCLAVTRKGGE